MLHGADVTSWTAEQWQQSDHVGRLSQCLDVAFRVFWAKVSEHTLAALFLWANEGWSPDDPSPPVVFTSATTLSHVVRREAAALIAKTQGEPDRISACLVEAHLRATRRLLDGYFFQGPYRIEQRWCEHCLGNHLSDTIAAKLGSPDPGLKLFRSAWPAVRRVFWQTCIQKPAKECRSLEAFFQKKDASGATTVQGGSGVSALQSGMKEYELKNSAVTGILSHPLYILAFAVTLGVGARWASVGEPATPVVLLEGPDPIAVDAPARPGPVIVPLPILPGGPSTPQGGGGAKGPVGGGRPSNAGRPGNTLQPGPADDGPVESKKERKKESTGEDRVGDSGVKQGRRIGSGSGDGGDGTGEGGGDTLPPKPPPKPISRFEQAKLELSSCITQTGKAVDYKGKTFTRGPSGVLIDRHEPESVDASLIEGALAMCLGRK